MIEWLDDVWSRTRPVQIVEGGENGGPLPGRGLLAELADGVSVDAARVLTTTGRFTGDICRCPGRSTIVLRDTAGEMLASAGLHGHGSVSWERSRFRNDLVVSDPAALHLFLAGHGIPNQLTSFLTPLAHLLNLHEGRPQFRPAGKDGKRYLTERGVPDVTAAAETRTREVAMGVVNLVMHLGDNGTLATAVGPTLRQLFPPAPATGTVR